MTNFRIALVFIVCFLVQHQLLSQNQQISFEASLDSLYKNSNALKAASNEVELSKRQRQTINALWYPTILATGTYAYMSNDIYVKQDYASLLKPFQESFSNYPIVSVLLGDLMNDLGDLSFVVPILDRQVFSADLELVYPVFTGLKRVYADRLAKDLEQSSSNAQKKVMSTLFADLAVKYFGLCLSEKIVLLNDSIFKISELHYQNAVRLEENGMINKADRLVVQVAMDNAKRTWKSSSGDLNAVRYSFSQMIGYEGTDPLSPSSLLFINDTIPDLSWFQQMMDEKAFINEQIDVQKEVKKDMLAISRSNYFPTISIVGKQTMFSSNIPKNLVPQSMVGANLTWTIFDGLAREREIQQTKIEMDIINEQEQSLKTELEIAVNDAYTQLTNVLNSLEELNASIEMAEEILHIRSVSFQEGMATADEVNDAIVLLQQVKTFYYTAYYEYDLTLATLCSLCGIPEYFEDFKAMGKTIE